MDGSSPCPWTTESAAVDTPRWVSSSPLLGEPLSPFLDRLWQLVDSCDFTGYDPGGIYYARRYLALVANRGRPTQGLPRLWNAAFQRAFRLGGYAAVRLVDPPKIQSAKAMALCASGLADLSEAFPEEDMHGVRGTALLARLAHQRLPEGYWSPDFSYRIRGDEINADERLPCVINSVFITDAFWQWYLRTQRQDYLDIVVSTAHALVEALPRYETDRTLCFTYHPATRYFVHNANLLLASLLARAAAVTSDSALATIVAKCVTYTVEDIECTQTVRYAGEPTPNPTVDNYHTGYVLRSLHAIRQAQLAAVDSDRLENAIRFVFDLYLRTFVDDRGVYKLANHRVQQTHSLAEALAVYVTFRDVFTQDQLAIHASGVRRTFHALWNERRRYFINEIHDLPLGFTRCDVTPLPRWAWSWMFYGLARLQASESTIVGQDSPSPRGAPGAPDTRP